MIIPTLTRLSDNLSVTTDTQERCVIYDITTYTPTVRLVLEAQEINALIAFWHNGYCAICGSSVPQRHHLCIDCLREETATWGQ